MFWTGGKLWGNDDHPGCLSGKGSDCCFPWSEECCEAERCTGIRVYCNTLEQLHRIIANMDNVLAPMTGEDTASGLNYNCEKCCNPQCAFTPLLPTELDQHYCGGGCQEVFEMSNNAILARCGRRYSSASQLATYKVTLYVTFVLTGDNGDSGSITVNGQSMALSLTSDNSSDSVSFEVDITTLFANTLVVSMTGPLVGWTAHCGVEVTLEGPGS